MSPLLSSSGMGGRLPACLPACLSIELSLAAVPALSMPSCNYMLPVDHLSGHSMHILLYAQTYVGQPLTGWPRSCLCHSSQKRLSPHPTWAAWQGWGIKHPARPRMYSYQVCRDPLIKLQAPRRCPAVELPHPSSCTRACLPAAAHAIPSLNSAGTTSDLQRGVPFSKTTLED